MWKDKSKSPLNKKFVNKKPQRALVALEEYFSDDDDDDDDDEQEGGEVVATVTVAISIESSPSSSLFKSPQREPSHHPQVPYGQDYLSNSSPKTIYLH